VKVQKTILIRPPKTPLIHLNQTRKLVGQLWEIKVITLFWPCATHTETSKASWWPPSISKAHAALEDLRLLLKPRKRGSQSTASQKLPLTLTERLNHMSRFLWAYTDVGHDGEPHSFNPVGGQWSKAADQTARTINFGEQKSSYLSWKLRKWTRAYISNWSTLPFQQKWQRSSAIDNEAVVEELSLHLCSIGKYAHAEDILDFLRDPKNKECLKVPGSISLKTAHHWMKRMGWQWKWEAKGQYVDGHKHEDVVTYRQNIFLPAWSNLQPQMRKWQVNPTNNDVKEIMEARTVPWRHAVVWFHGKSTLDANNQQKLRWVHQTENAVPQPKGEGVSLMVSDFVSADYGWLWSPNGNESACVLFKAGKGSDGYFTNDEVVAQVGNAMDILVKHYLNKEHIFMFDNAKTHLKCASDVLSARKMPKSPSESWGIMVIAKDANGKPVHDGNGNVVKEKIQVTDAQLPKGTPQPLYFLEGHERAGWFKGMAQILVEWGDTNAPCLPAGCKGFKCPSDKTECCCHRLMFNQPDFTNVESIVETTCQSCGSEVIFLPKFHCKLNFIEQCWGFAKWIYWMKPCPTSEDALERSIVDSLKAVPMNSMRQ